MPVVVFMVEEGSIHGTGRKENQNAKVTTEKRQQGEGEEGKERRDVCGVSLHRTADVQSIEL